MVITNYYCFSIVRWFDNIKPGICCSTIYLCYFLNDKKNFFSFTLSFLVLIFIEFSSRIFFSIFSKSFYPLIYGFNKNILINVEDLSKFNFNTLNLNITKINYNKKKYNNNKAIWVFGGSTSDTYCYNGTWSDELQLILPDYKVENFATGGASTDINLNTLLRNKDKQLPQIILWANRFNEDFILYFGTTRNKLFFNKNKIDYKKNNYLYIIKSIDLTLKKKSVFYFLFNDLVERINYKTSGPKKPKEKQIYYNEDLELAVKNYEINTEAAIKFSKENIIDFYIVSLFGKYNYEDNSFFTKPLYPILKSKMIELQKKWNINFIDTEKNLVLDQNIKYFCDNVHPTIIGNKLTAEIIYENINR